MVNQKGVEIWGNIPEILYHISAFNQLLARFGDSPASKKYGHPMAAC
jgi:hypothetical protein